MPLSSACVVVGIIHICAVVKNSINIHQNLFFFLHCSLSHKSSIFFFFFVGKAGMMLLTRSPLGPLSPGLPVAPLE